VGRALLAKGVGQTEGTLEKEPMGLRGGGGLGVGPRGVGGKNVSRTKNAEGRFISGQEEARPTTTGWNPAGEGVHERAVC